MKVLLVNPKFPYKGRDKFPIGLGYIASVLRNYCEVEIADENIGIDAIEYVKKYKPDIVGITSTTPSFGRAKEIGNFCNEREIKVIAGGVHATFCPEDALEFAEIVVRGEGEKTIEEIFSGKELNKILGISYKEDGKTISTPLREHVRDIDILPIPSYDLFPLEEYKMMSIVTSRGCFYNCSYCCATRFWGCKVRFHSVERVVTEFELIHDLGFKYVKIHDSTFTLNKKRVMKICDELVKREIDISWSCETRADYLDKELLEKMKMAGCSLICMGIDSADEKVLKMNRRFFNLSYAEEIFKLCRKIGIKTRAYVVFGLEGETEESVKKTIEYIKRINPDQIMLSLATAYPGTELFNGNLIEMSDSWAAKFEGHGRGAKLYLPRTLAIEEYKKLAEFIWKEIKNLKITKNRVSKYDRNKGNKLSCRKCI